MVKLATKSTTHDILTQTLWFELEGVCEPKMIPLYREGRKTLLMRNEFDGLSFEAMAHLYVKTNQLGKIESLSVETDYIANIRERLF